MICRNLVCYAMQHTSPMLLPGMYACDGPGSHVLHLQLPCQHASFKQRDANIQGGSHDLVKRNVTADVCCASTLLHGKPEPVICSSSSSSRMLVGVRLMLSLVTYGHL
jgi:hypothetical protein